MRISIHSLLSAILLSLTSFLYAVEPDVPASTAGICKFLVVYYPFKVRVFPDSAAKPSFEPVPAYDKWSVDRIDRDLSRIHSSGLSGVLLAIEPSDLNDSHKFDMISTFLVLASKVENFKVAFLFAPSRPTQLSKSNVSSFLKRKKLLDYSSVYKFSDCNAIFFAENVELVSSGAPDFLYVKVNLSGITADHDQLTSTGLIDYTPVPMPLDNIETNFHFVQIFAGLSIFSNDKIQWIVSRRNGHVFHSNIDTCIKLTPDLAIISSWNDYAQGSAIENNTLDNTQMQEILMKSIQKLKSDSTINTK